MTSEQRKDIARKWASCSVPAEDIIRLLNISEDELAAILNEPAKEGQ